jgi:hypothetical protein
LLREIAGLPGQRRQGRASGRNLTPPSAIVRRSHIHDTDGEVDMTAIDTFEQRAKRELDLQLDKELEGTFPASDQDYSLFHQISRDGEPTTEERYCTER